MQKLKNCLNDIQNFMFANKLKLNPDKTEFILISPRKIITNSSLTSIKSTRAQARDLYRIRPLLDMNTSVLLANALVSSRLDYCNSLFLSLTDFEIRRLQLVQNSLCRVVTHSSKFSHITPQLKKAPLASSKIQSTIQNRSYYIHNSQPGSTSLPKRINPALLLSQKHKAKYPQTQVPSNPHL